MVPSTLCQVSFVVEEVTVHNTGIKALSHCAIFKVAGDFSQCNVGWLAIFLLLEALHEIELSSTFRNGLQQLITPLHSVASFQQLVSQFYGSFNKGACAHFLFFVPRSIARQVAEKIAV